MDKQQKPLSGRWLLWRHALLLISLAMPVSGNDAFAQDRADPVSETPAATDEKTGSETPAEPASTSPDAANSTTANDSTSTSDSTTATESTSATDNEGAPASTGARLSPAADTDASKSVDPWELFFPPPDSRYDWIKLTSGEWLKGELRGLYKYQLEFDSDELGVHTFSWDDIAAIRSAGLQAVGYEDSTNGTAPVTAYGKLTLIGNTATIGSGPGATTIRRDQIITIATGSKKELDLWSGEVSLGANLQRGNSDLSTTTIYLLARRRSSVTRFHFDYRGNFSKSDNVETSNNHRANLWFDSFRTSRLYWRVVFAEYFRDRFQNIQNQLTLGTGIGYDIIRTPRTEWDVSAGIGALYKEAASVEANEDPSNTSPALSLGTHYDVELTSQLDYLFDYRAQVTDKDNGSYISHLVTTLSSDLIGNLDLDLTFIWDYTADPRPAADGTVPDKNDYGMTVSLSYDF